MIDKLRFQTRIVMRRHRVIRWVPLAQPVPEWIRRGTLAKDFTESESRVMDGNR
jgi:hypothetical protein